MATTAPAPATLVKLVSLRFGGMFKRSSVAELENENFNHRYNNLGCIGCTIWNSSGGEYIAMKYEWEIPTWAYVVGVYVFLVALAKFAYG